MLESKNIIANPWMGQLKFSEQMIVDCNIWGYDCNGGATAAIIGSWMVPNQVEEVLRADYEYITAQNPSCNTAAPRLNV